MKKIDTNVSTRRRLEMKNRKLQSAFLFIVTICLMLVTGACTKKQETATEIKIGALLPLTGDNGSYGVDCRKGMELALEEYNAANKQKVVIFFEDTKAEPKTAVTAINKLITMNNPKIILGDMFSNTTLAVAPIAQQNGIVLITPTAALETIPATGDHIFTIYPTSKYEGQLVASFALKKGLKRLGVIKQQVQVAEEIGDAFAEKIKSEHGDIVFNEVVPSDVKDFRNILSKYINKNVDAIFVSAYRDEAGNIIKQARELGYNKLFLSQSTLYDEKVLQLFGKSVDGVIFSAPYFNNLAESNTIKVFQTQFQKKYHAKPNIWAAYGYDVVNLTLQAVDQSEKNKKTLPQTLSDIKFDGVTGTMSFFPNRTVNKTMEMFTIKDNSFQKAEN
jgi:branched-chain amino acid transport system substrate-binding protein